MPDKKFSSIRELFLRNKRDLLRYLTRRVGREDAPDLLQETFVRALRHDQFETVVDSPAFLQKIAINLTKDFVRRRMTEEKHLEFGDLPDGVPSGDASPEMKIEHEQKARLILATIETLPPRCREVCILVMHEGIPLDQVSKQLGITETMTRRHLRLALLRCRAALD
jgi:RNA polymerase sigma factor (sigma-70 family)